jgi:ankyrin repeat protein
MHRLVKIVSLILVAAESPVYGAVPVTELLDALRDAKLAVSRKLIAGGASLNATDDFGCSPLMYAALYGDARLVRLLLEHGANPNHANNAGATALMWAVPDKAKVRLLLAKGANVNVRSKITGLTPVLIAAGRPGAGDVVRLLLAHGADLKAHSNDGVTALHRAVSSGDRRIFRLVLDGGADVNARGPWKNTALMEAVAQGNAYMAKALIKRGADTKARDAEGSTALTSALSYRNSSFRDY